MKYKQRMDYLCQKKADGTSLLEVIELEIEGNEEKQLMRESMFSSGQQVKLDKMIRATLAAADITTTDRDLSTRLLDTANGRIIIDIWDLGRKDVVVKEAFIQTPMTKEEHPEDVPSEDKSDEETPEDTE